MVLINYVSATSPRKLYNLVNIHGDSTGKTALHNAVEEGFPSIVSALLKIPGIDIDRRDYNGQTPLYRSFLPNCPVSIPIALIWHGADLRIPDNTNFTPLNMALLFWKVDWFVPLVLDYINYDIHRKDENGDDLLRKAVQSHSLVIARKLLKMGGDPNSTNNKGISTKDSIDVRDDVEMSELFNVEPIQDAINNNGYRGGRWRRDAGSYNDDDKDN